MTTEVSDLDNLQNSNSKSPIKELQKQQNLNEDLTM